MVFGSYLSLRKSQDCYRTWPQNPHRSVSKNLGAFRTFKPEALETEGVTVQAITLQRLEPPGQFFFIDR